MVLEALELETLELETLALEALELEELELENLALEALELEALGAGESGAGATGAGGAGAGGAGAEDPGSGCTGALDPGGGGAGAGDPGAGGAGAKGAGAGGTIAGGTVQRRQFFVPQPPSSLPPPDLVLRQVLTRISTTSSFSFSLATPLDYAASLVAGSVSNCPPSVRGECALGTDVLEDRQEDFECLAAAVPRFAAMGLAPEGDVDTPHISTPRSYAEAITGPYSSQWQTAMNAEMACWKSTGTYFDAGTLLAGAEPEGAESEPEVLQRFGFRYSSPQSTPLPTGHSLSAPSSDASVEPNGLYPELLGCVITSGMGLVVGGHGPVVLTGHADASWVDDLAKQRSSQGYTFSLGFGSVSWRSTRSSSVLSSSCEAEIYAGAMAAQELRWLTYVLTDLGEAPCSPPVL
ncbi:unnamed protein product, partial [Closterium sp. NIES-53]